MKKTGKEQAREPENDTDRDDPVRPISDKEAGETDTFNPRTGEDPGLLELTEDPRERRLKRHTM